MIFGSIRFPALLRADNPTGFLLAKRVMIKGQLHNYHTSVHEGRLAPDSMESGPAACQWQKPVRSGLVWFGLV
jgi:hypothetical protein